MKQLGLCLCLNKFTPSESPMTSVSFTVLYSLSLSHDNLLSSRFQLSILAITGVSDTIPPRLLLPSLRADVGAVFRRSRERARRRAARPFAGRRQRQVGWAVTDMRPNERGGLGDG